MISDIGAEQPSAQIPDCISLISSLNYPNFTGIKVMMSSSSVMFQPAPQIKPKEQFGFAACGYQVWGRRGGGKSNWSRAADNGTVPEPAYSCNHYDNYEADLDIMAAAGANSYRISLEWADFQDGPEQWNDKAITFYRKLFAACKARNIKPMATLLHFTEPTWFTDLGSFEKEENIKYFVTFCQKMFELYRHDITHWGTINEPAIQSFSAYLHGGFPPHRHNLQLTLDVLLNFLKAHAAVYKALKAMPGGDKAQIGLVHNVLKFKPLYWVEPIENNLATFLTELTHNLVMIFLKEGTFNYYMPGVAFKKYSDPDVVGVGDFIGLNFYANAVIGFNLDNLFGPTYFKGQKMGDLALVNDPPGFAAALVECAAFGKPVIVTEFGIADASDKLRVELVTEYLKVYEAMRAANVDLQGLFFWTFKDNYEWAYGFWKKFGMYYLDGTKKDSAVIYEKYMQEKQLVLSTANTVVAFPRR
jgi:beta-glucosidase